MDGNAARRSLRCLAAARVGARALEAVGLLITLGACAAASGVTQGAAPRAASGVADPGGATPGPGGYGRETVTVDLVAAALVGAGFAADSDGLVVGGAALYLGGAPIIHRLHGQPARSWKSVLMRLLAPTLAGGLGYGVGHLYGRATCEPAEREGGCPGQHAVGVGVVAGLGALITVTVVDALWLAEPAPPRTTSVPLQVAPIATPAGFAVVGRF